MLGAPTRFPMVFLFLLALTLSVTGQEATDSDNSTPPVNSQAETAEVEASPQPDSAGETDDRDEFQPENKTDPNDPVDVSEFEDPDDAEGESDPEGENESAEDDEPNWMKTVDEKFGEYVVRSAATVLFFDFYSGPRDVPKLDADGNPMLDPETGEELTEVSPGWLKTGRYPDGISVPFVVVWLFFGAFFLTLRMRFINFRGFRHAVDLTRGVYDTPGEPGEVSHFQALSAALSATVGLGNIAGVAIAISTGGPGATFWIILVGLLGMTAKFTECTLGQLYRTSDEDGRVLGGPMRYLKFGLADIGLAPLGKILAVLFMLLCIGASFGGGNAFQVGQSLEAIRGDENLSFLQDYPYVYGIVMAGLVGIVIIGGIKSIGAVAGRIVPFMCLAYVVAALYILAINANAIPDALTKIVTEAFSPNAAFGGFLGILVIGIQRAVFSNEAGVGSAAIAHSAAKTDEPVSEGIVALLEPFIDTVIVCTITALVVIVTGAYEAPEMSEAIADKQGAKVTLHAFITGGHDWFRYILYVAVVLFAYSTCISWSYYGERCWVELFGARSSLMYKFLFLVFTVLGSIITRGNVLDFSDLMILGMSFPNLLGVFLLSGLVKRRLDVYWNKYKSGDLARADDVKS